MTIYIQGHIHTLVLLVLLYLMGFFLSILQDADGCFDEALRLAGNWGFWQKKVFVVAHMSQVFCSIHAVSAGKLGDAGDGLQVVIIYEKVVVVMWWW